jgi:hypothetical protein
MKAENRNKFKKGFMKRILLFVMKYVEDQDELNVELMVLMIVHRISLEDFSQPMNFEIWNKYMVMKVMVIKHQVDETSQRARRNNK